MSEKIPTQIVFEIAETIKKLYTELAEARRLLGEALDVMECNDPRQPMLGRMRAALGNAPAPVPAQPAVPDDADQNALRLALVWRVATGRETDEERAELGAVSPDATYGEFIAGIDAAILSATEGRKDD